MTLNNPEFELWWRQTGRYQFTNHFVEEHYELNPDQVIMGAKLVAQEAWEGNSTVAGLLEDIAGLKRELEDTESLLQKATDKLEKINELSC